MQGTVDTGFGTQRRNCLDLSLRRIPGELGARASWGALLPCGQMSQRAVIQVWALLHAHVCAVLC